MRRLGAALAVSLLLAVPATSGAQTLSELFQKAKAQVKGESWAEALKTLDALDKESSKVGNETAREQLAAPLAFYRGVCEANVGQAEKATVDFEIFLQAQPNASMDPSMYSKAAIAAFDAARLRVSPPATSAGDGKPSIFLAFQEFKAPPNSGEQVGATWGDGPIRWIMSADEKKRWAELSAGADWQEFVDQFWERRNPQPGNPDNIARTNFDRRVAFADAYFVQAEETRGSMTDRGMVFVLLGPPTYGGKKPLRTGDDVNDAAGMSTVGSQDAANAQNALTAGGKPSGATRAIVSDQFNGPGTKVVDSSPNWREVWHYRKELLPKGVGYQQVDVEFITKKGYGLNVMQRDHSTLATLEAARKVPAPASAPAPAK
jgi:GWxTD domain-containing protein